MYCRECGAKTDVRKSRCPICGANQRKRRFSFFLLIAVVLACAMLCGVFVLGNRLQQQQALTQPAAYTAQTPSASAAQADGDDTVYVTYAGTKYHKAGCSYLNDSKESLSLREAQSLGYTPCAFCFGD